jgi:hypothetical protein
MRRNMSLSAGCKSANSSGVSALCCLSKETYFFRDRQRGLDQSQEQLDVSGCTRPTCSGVGSKLLSSDKKLLLHNSLSNAKIRSHSCSGSRRLVLFIRISVRQGKNEYPGIARPQPAHAPTCFLTDGSKTLFNSSFFLFAVVK